MSSRTKSSGSSPRPTAANRRTSSSSAPTSAPANPKTPGRSDTTILLRLDPDQSTISLISIPRDLKVEIPGVGTAKFNEAYAVGGPKLTLQVVKELTGLPINHVVNVDYLGFVRAVDAIGCVYVDVDRRYYHSNAGLPPSEQYSEINIKPGYQLLCGKKALQYVRYRHTDTDLVRSARQQDFLSDARERVPIADLVLDKHQLIDIFTEYTTSDISDAETMLQVLKLFVASRNATINEVNFPAELGPSYVYSSPEMIEEAIEKFLGSEASGGPRGSLDEPSRSAAGRRRARRRSTSEQAEAEGEAAGDDGLVPAREAGELEAAPIARKVSRGFPVFYPTRLPSGAAYEETDPYEHIVDPRVYHLKDHGRQPPRRLPDGRHPRTPRRGPLLRRAGDPGLERPADPQQPEPDRNDPRPRIRHLPRRGSDQDDRLAPGGQHLLGVEQPAAGADQ